jgi:glutamine amidotransferase
VSGIAIVDYDLGNVRSVGNAFAYCGAQVSLTRNHKELMGASGLILPGVGSFAFGASQLRKYGLFEVIKSFSESGKPILGICLGMQLLMSQGEEHGQTEGLGLIKGVVKSLRELGGLNGRLPHVGWNSLAKPEDCSWSDTILNDVEEGTCMYFVHSYAAIPIDPLNRLSETEYGGVRFCSSIRSGNIYGCQFHPEKSGHDGLRLIKQFVSITNEFI